MTRWSPSPLALAVGAAVLGTPLLLADPPPALLPAALAAACWWLAAQGVILGATVAWDAAGAREVGAAQIRHAAGVGVAAQAALRARAAAGRSLAQVPVAAVGGVLAASAAQARAGELALSGRGAPGLPLLAAAVAGPVIGVALGTLAGLAARTRRQLGVAVLASVMATVSVFLLRPFSALATRVSVATPLGGVWPVTPGWSLDRYLALDAGLAARAASVAGWTLLLVLAAARAVRSGAARRSAPPTDLA